MASKDPQRAEDSYERLSQVIVRLQNLMEVHGDVPVGIDTTGERTGIAEIYYHQDSNTIVFF